MPKPVLRLCTFGAVAAFVLGGTSPAMSQVPRLRVAAYNIKHGRGMDDRVDLERVASVLRRMDADVITLQEVDDRTERTGGVDQVAEIARLLGYEGVHGPHRPFQGGFYGNAVLTRLPVRLSRTHPIPPASGSALAVHEVVVGVPVAGSKTDSLPVSVVSVHLAGSVQERRAQAEAVTATFEAAGRPMVLAGDFNGRPDDPVVSWLGRRWQVGTKAGDPRTYPSPEPDREIDFVMWRSGSSAEGRVDLTLIEHRVIAEPLASDHRPILAVFELRPADDAIPLARGLGR
jgi:endonuclease/exonuclease/phosphatase family metal-dependent hydrolase